MHWSEYVSVLREDGDRLVEVAARAGLDAAVPTCPGWRIRDLLRHLGGVHRWAAAYVGTGRNRPFAGEEERRFFTHPGDDGLLDWLHAGHRALVGTLTVADPAVDCWSFLPAPSPLTFWARRQAHETAIHRADAESAIGAVPEWEPHFAIDGIGELLYGFFARRPDRITADVATTMALVATDVDAAWTVSIGPTGFRVDSGGQSADLTVTAPATQLYLLLWNRIDADRIGADGDLGVLRTWRASAAVTWS